MKRSAGSNQYVRDVDGLKASGRDEMVEQRRAVEDPPDVDSVAWAFHPDRRMWEQAGWKTKDAPQDWVAAGWTSPHQARIWFGCHFSPGDAVLWRDCGFDAAQAMQCRELWDNPTELVQWQRVGFSVRDATSWRHQKFDLETASLWRSTTRLGARDARAWVTVGFDGHPLTAERLQRCGINPDRWKKHRMAGVPTEVMERYALNRIGLNA